MFEGFLFMVKTGVTTFSTMLFHQTVNPPNTTLKRSHYYLVTMDVSPVPLSTTELTFKTKMTATGHFRPFKPLLLQMG